MRRRKRSGTHSRSHRVVRGPQTLSHLQIVEPLEVDMEVGFDTFHGSGQSYASDEQDKENHVRHRGCDVHYLKYTQIKQSMEI